MYPKLRLVTMLAALHQTEHVSRIKLLVLVGVIARKPVVDVPKVFTTVVYTSIGRAHNNDRRLADCGTYDRLFIHGERAYDIYSPRNRVYGYTRDRNAFLRVAAYESPAGIRIVGARVFCTNGDAT